jgi:hypothetical protein
MRSIAGAATVDAWLAVSNVANVLTNHASQIMAADLFVVPSITFPLLFVLVIL